MAVVLLVAGTGVFVAAEFALVAADRNKLSAEAEAGNRRARVAVGLLRRLSFHLSGAQLGITITSLVLGVIAEPTIAQLIAPLLEPFLGERATHAVSVAVALVIATFLSMVLGELVPKSVAIAKPEPITRWLAVPLQVYGIVFGPIIRVLNAAANWLVRRFGIEPKEELSSVRSLSELAMLAQISAEEGALASSASRLLARSIRFSEKTAADVLIPRVEVQAISRDASVADLVELATATGLSRLVVYGNDLDDVAGVVHVKQVHQLPREERATTPVATLLSPVVAVPETRDVQSLLLEMRDRREHLVVVVDEYGGTAGIITLEDLLEEIVGEIDDEYDPLTPVLTQRLPSGSFVVAGGLHPDEVRDATGFSMPEGDYETIAGFVLARLGHLPQPGESFTEDRWTFTVEEVNRRRLARVRLTRPPDDAEADADRGSER